jgi:tetratricopeptide (TPR) repeat protein
MPVTNENLTMLDQKYQQAQADDYLGLLDANAKTQEIMLRKRYLELVKLFHPDNLTKGGMADEKKKASLVFQKLAEALEVLIDPDKRSVYLGDIESFGNQAAPDGKSAKDREEDARISLHQAKLLLRSRSFDGAITMLKQYLGFSSEDPEGYILLGWAHFQNPATQGKLGLERAAECWLKAVQLDGENADAQYHLSLYYKAIGNKKAQQKHLRKALQMNRRHVAAQRELRLLEMRESKAEKHVESIGDYLKRKWKELTKK